MNARALESAYPEPEGSDPSSSDTATEGVGDLVPVSCPLKRILLVDDQAHVLRVMRLSLDRNGYEVETALNSEVALRLLHETPCDVIITGMDLPISTVRYFCQSVHQQFPNGTPFFLIATSEPHDSPQLEWINTTGDTELLPAPLSLRWVVARLSQHFGTI